MPKTTLGCGKTILRTSGTKLENSGKSWINYKALPILRFHSLILVHEDNVLRADIVQRVSMHCVVIKLVENVSSYFQMYSIYQKVNSLQTSNGKTWHDLCVQIPVVDIDVNVPRGKRSAEDVDYNYDDYFWEHEETEDSFEL